MEDRLADQAGGRCAKAKAKARQKHFPSTTIAAQPLSHSVQIDSEDKEQEDTLLALLFYVFHFPPLIDTEALSVLHSQKQLHSSGEKLLCHMGSDALISFRQKRQWLILDQQQTKSWVVSVRLNRHRNNH